MTRIVVYAHRYKRPGAGSDTAFGLER